MGLLHPCSAVNKQNISMLTGVGQDGKQNFPDSSPLGLTAQMGRRGPAGLGSIQASRHPGQLQRTAARVVRFRLVWASTALKA